MGKLLLTLFLLLGFTACGDGSGDVVTEEEAGEYIETNDAHILESMMVSRFPESNCVSFYNDDNTHSINSIKVSRDGSLRPILTEPNTVLIDDAAEKIGFLKNVESIENANGSYRLIYSLDTLESLGIEAETTEVVVYFAPDSPNLYISEFEKINGSSVGRPTRFLSYRKTDLTELSQFNALLDKHCR